MNNSLTESPFIPLRVSKYNEFFFIYNGPSMSPLFKPGDLICARKIILGDIRLGDIIIVDWGLDKNHIKYVIHRVVSVEQEYLITQGDNNSKPDVQVVTEDNLIGLVTSFHRQNRIYLVTGGGIGLIHAWLVHTRNYIWWVIRRLGWRVYHLIRQSGLVAKLWRPAISRICVTNDNGSLIKYSYGKRTVAHWWPETNKFDVIKPFDLVIPKPQEPK